MSWIATAIIVAAGISVGVSQQQQVQEKKRQKSMLEYQQRQVAEAEKKVAGAKSLATQEAASMIKKRRLAQTQTILTSPLGISDEANIGTRSLLGG